MRATTFRLISYHLATLYQTVISLSLILADSGLLLLNTVSALMRTTQCASPLNRKVRDDVSNKLIVRYMAEEMLLCQLSTYPDLSIIDLHLGPKVDLPLKNIYPRISLHLVL